MNYQSLIYFKTVAELQHFTQAANQLFITQPALSKAIHNLEAELGCSLFQRIGRNVVLTEYGLCFYNYVKRSVEEIDEGVEAVKHLVAVNKNTIHISALFSVHSLFLPNCIYCFRQENPHVHFVLEHKFTSSVLDDMIKRKCDLGICSNFVAEGPLNNLDRVSLFQEKLCLIVNKKHPFANRSVISPNELRDEPFIVYSWSKHGINHILTQVCNEYGFEPYIHAEGYNDYGIFGMVAAGEGIAITAASDAFKNDNVVQVEIDTNVPMLRDIFLVWRKGELRSPSVEAFRKRLIHDASKLPSPIITQ